MQTFYPSLRYRDARAAIDWLVEAFGFSEHVAHEHEGKVVHAELSLGGAFIMLGTEEEGEGKFGSHAGTGWSYVAIEDPDAMHERASAAGAKVVIELSDTDYGSREFSAADPEGNLWSFGTYRP